MKSYRRDHHRRDDCLGLSHPHCWARLSLVFGAPLRDRARGLALRVGPVSVNQITNRRAESFYGATISVSNTLGTALGDCLADTTTLGHEGGALVFAGALGPVLAAYFGTGISRTILFWSAFILTRSLGATLGDIVTKPVADGGLNLNRITPL